MTLADIATNNDATSVLLIVLLVLLIIAVFIWIVRR